MTAAVVAAGSGGVGGLFASTTYTGDGSTRNIATGQNLAAGGLVWGKGTTNTRNHLLVDTVRGNTKYIRSNDTTAEQTDTNLVTAFNSSGVALGTGANLNAASEDFVIFSWLEQAGYLDIVQETGTGAAKTVSHSLGVAPDMIAAFNLSGANNWTVYHSSLDGSNPENYRLNLNTDAARSLETNNAWNDTAPTTTQFTVGSGAAVNGSGDSIIYYLFAEKAGSSKFGTYSGTSTINTGLPSVKSFLVKRTDAAGDWYLFYEDGGTWYHVKPNTKDVRATGLISVSGGDVTLSGAAAAGNGVYSAWK